MHRRTPQLMNVDDSSNVVAVYFTFFSVRFRFADLVRVHHETTDSFTRRLIPAYILQHSTYGCCRCGLFVNVLSLPRSERLIITKCPSSQFSPNAIYTLHFRVWCRIPHMKMSKVVQRSLPICDVRRRTLP